jgi:protoheme IX farnesyltransferase
LSTETINENSVTTKLSIRDIAAFCKLRLATLVVMSAAFCFVLASDVINYNQLILLIIGGFLVTASSNGFNQIIERNLDKLMNRTQNRPLPSGRMTLNQAYFIASTLGLLGIIILWVFINPLSGILGTLALILYTFVYTPLKQKTPLAVFVGAFPGAIPPMLGYVAVSGEMSIAAVIVFSVQFMWQFPHFWAIAWVLDDDYKKAGFYLLPVSLMPIVFNISGSVAAIIIILCGIGFIAQAIKLYRLCDVKSAQQLMFGSFFYLPLVQIALMIDKI